MTAVDPRLAYDVDMETTADMPSTEPFEGMAYEEWEEHVLRHPLFAPAGSFVALVDGEAAALSLLTADPESGRAMSWMTGTRRAYRGRGLALAVKLASIEWAAANGITRMLTFNDATNAPMLAVNRRLGYEPIGRRVEWLKVSRLDVEMHARSRLVARNRDHIKPRRNGFFASAASTCDVTHTGVVAYFAE